MHRCNHCVPINSVSFGKYTGINAKTGYISSYVPSFGSFGTVLALLVFIPTLLIFYYVHTYLLRQVGINFLCLLFLRSSQDVPNIHRMFLYYLVHQFFPIHSELLKQEAPEIFDLIQNCTYTIWNPNMIMIPTLIFVYTFYSRLSHSMGSRIR